MLVDGAKFFRPSSATSAYETLYEVDFTAHGSVDVATGTLTVTPDTGTTFAWTADNDGNDASGIEIVNGSGLRFNPNAGTQVGVSTYTAPAIRVALSSIVASSLATEDVILVTMQLDANEPLANTDGRLFAIHDAATLGAAGTDGYEMRRVYNSGEKVVSATWASGSRDAGSDNETTPVRVMSMLIYGGLAAVTYYSTDTADYDAPEALSATRYMAPDLNPATAAVVDLGNDAQITIATADDIGTVYVEKLKIERRITAR